MIVLRLATSDNLLYYKARKTHLSIAPTWFVLGLPFIVLRLMASFQPKGRMTAVFTLQLLLTGEDA